MTKERKHLQSRFEKLPVHVFQDSSTASREVAKYIAETIRRKQGKGQPCVLGLATGSSPKNVYAELVKMHKEEGLSFQNVISFNLDEYFPMQPDAIQSYVHFMNEHLFKHIDIKKENVHIPDGSIELAEIPVYCALYEKKIKEAGGLDIQILGIGRTGHIGFNEPGSEKKEGTRMVTLDHMTRMDAASDFFGVEHVPQKAITMGVGTIMNAKSIILMAWGENKSEIIKRTVEGGISDQVPATYLQEHPNTIFYIDRAAGAKLTRFETPWVMGSCEWDQDLIKKSNHSFVFKNK